MSKTNLKFKPLHDRVLIEPWEAKTKTKAGVIIPETAQKNPPGGIVVAVGPGIDGPLTVKKGDKVVFHSHSGESILFDKETLQLVTPDTPADQTVVYKTMREAEIIAIL